MTIAIMAMLPLEGAKSATRIVDFLANNGHFYQGTKIEMPFVITCQVNVGNTTNY